MKKSAPQPACAPADGRTGFAGRAPSQAWEPIALPESPENYAWAWFRPVHLPHGLILRVPDELYQNNPQFAAQWTVRKLLRAAGVAAEEISAWNLYGVAYPSAGGATPLLDAPIPPPVPGVDPNIAVFMNVPPVPPVVPPLAAPAVVAVAPAAVQIPVAAASPAGIPPAAATGPLDAAKIEIYERIEADWHQILEIERDLGRQRKQLLDLMGRLKTLNRDLSAQERIHSSSQDKKDWQDARRGLRDNATRLWKHIKAYDIGDTSSAGKRNWFEQIYVQYIGPRKRYAELTKVQKAFESYLKLIQSLHSDMMTEYSVARNDGERPAQQVINRIMQKVREATNKKNFLGVMLDN